MLCQRCGSLNGDDAVFCENCGAKLEQKPPIFPSASSAAQPGEIVGGNLAQQGMPMASPARQQGMPTANFTPQQGMPASAQSLRQGMGSPPSPGVVGGYAREARPLQKTMIVLIAEIVALFLLTVFLFKNTASLFDAEKIGERYFAAVASGDWEAAYPMLEAEESAFLTEESYREANQSNVFPTVNAYAVKKQQEMDEGILGTSVTVTYRGLGDSYDSSYLVFLNRQPKKKFFIFDDWKVSADQIVAKNCVIQVPSGASASVDGVRLTLQTASLSREDGYDIYTIPALFKGEHTVSVSMDGMKTAEKSFHTDYDSGCRLDDLKISGETARMLIETAGGNMQKIYTAALHGNTYATVAELFTADEEAGVEDDYWNLMESMQGSGISWTDAIDFSKISGTAGSYMDGGKMVVEVALTFDYRLTYTYENWEGEMQNETSADSDEVIFYFIQENGSWVLSNLGCHDLYY